MPLRLYKLQTACLAALFLLLTAIHAACLSAAPVAFTDALGRHIELDHPPRRVVSLVPSITEMIFAVGAGRNIAAVTHHDTWPPEAARKPLVGGYFSPSIEAVAAFRPDVIFISDLHQAVSAHFQGTPVKTICLPIRSLRESFASIRLIGEIFGRQPEAESLAAGIREELALIRQKVAKIPSENRRRVIRLMGRDRVMSPGDDSFQNDMIRAAGGIAPHLGKTGPVVDVSLAQWQAFNPQVIYGCGQDRNTARALLDKPGWRDVEAVQAGRIYYFPCNLTCRAATKSGYFVGWLSARLYAAEFADTQNQVHADGIFKRRPITIDLPYVLKAGVAYSRRHDFTNKTLLVEFKHPLRIVSTLDGQRDGIRTIGNHFSPPPSWVIDHNAGLSRIRAGAYTTLGLPADTTALLLTGADMDHLVIKQERFKQMAVTVLVTAGVRGNAVRMSRDPGTYYEPGTINIIILPNLKLSERAMTRAIISATEGKTAALLDMDIRSSYAPVKYKATGTGTDNIIVASGAGNGKALDNAGGHSKLGELVARAVYTGVQEAVFSQNGLAAGRNIFQRLKERQITLNSLVAATDCECGRPRSQISAALEKVLLDPRYSAFMETALALSDEYEKGWLKDLSLYRQWCKETAAEIAGRRIADMRVFDETRHLPVVLKIALNALLNGVYHQPPTAEEG